MYYNTDVRRNNEPIFVFNCRSSSIAITILYLQGHINTYAYIILQKMKSLYFTTQQGNYAFLAANLNKLRSNDTLSNSV